MQQKFHLEVQFGLEEKRMACMDEGTKPGQVWLEKDIILPYVANVNLCDAKCMFENQSKKETHCFSFGKSFKRNAGGKIRSKLVQILRDTEGVIIEEGSTEIAGRKPLRMACGTRGISSIQILLNHSGEEDFALENEGRNGITNLQALTAGAAEATAQQMEKQMEPHPPPKQPMHKIQGKGHV
ncbi:hypothetical protein HPP92_013283 [Vanilla planifolia]|uniref:Uncharacterized protein n=1 Tax=Vanilla planifolia TaxID=51239 RepID=A0A835QZ37_VANPL|nr:hypothetical protein HPP92_013283 [Vanilla planifolia]